MTLDEALEEISVHGPGDWDNTSGPPEWYAVSDESGIVAYFGKETDAFHWRLALINARLNPVGKQP